MDVVALPDVDDKGTLGTTGVLSPRSKSLPALDVVVNAENRKLSFPNRDTLEMRKNGVRARDMKESFEFDPALSLLFLPLPSSGVSSRDKSEAESEESIVRDDPLISMTDEGRSLFSLTAEVRRVWLARLSGKTTEKSLDVRLLSTGIVTGINFDSSKVSSVLSKNMFFKL